MVPDLGPRAWNIALSDEPELPESATAMLRCSAARFPVRELAACLTI